ncbi:FxDxF family PEP-CTERM protein [Xylophilus sp. GOD-11R]|nr:FxDxF family PEP-CTERM protein [Xylophilus sp. GOD-11R]WPB57248.1 FxDxF family PEP-CTERM protein [Xylophilus sp. GOD-11R]
MPSKLGGQIKSRMKMVHIAKFGLHVVLAAALGAFGLAANAADYQFSGDTTGKPTFVRPYLTGVADPVPTEVAYATFEFSVSTSGTYAFLSKADYDNYTFLYQNSFRPDLPLVNYMAGNDDLDGNSRESGFTISLTQGVNYIFVNTGNRPYSTGPFTTQISGLGTVQALAAVPEPETYAMLLAGLGLVGAMARRRQIRSQTSPWLSRGIFRVPASS